MIIDILGGDISLREGARERKLAMEGLSHSLSVPVSEVIEILLDMAEKHLKERNRRLEQKKYVYVGLVKTVVGLESPLPGGPSKWIKYLFKNKSD